MDKGKSKAPEEEEKDSDSLKLHLFLSPSPSSFQYSDPMQNLSSPDDTVFYPSSSSPTTQSLQPPIIPQNPNDGDPTNEIIPVPFPWATDRKAMLKSLSWLKNNQILTITGMVQCKTCDMSYEIGFDLLSKFDEIFTYINMHNMYDRAPKVWMTPRLPLCKNCGNSVRPFVSEDMRSINWLFLFLGQMLGCCTLEQLKYYCKHTGSFRTGAKDRILYGTYLGICEQLLVASDI
ncbi:hypothetical protein K1719_000694 [Acacia pycnantha]|nr:hypothetical protein K1719_000694 [Acacia pycnantha]